MDILRATTNPSHARLRGEAEPALTERVAADLLRIGTSRSNAAQAAAPHFVLAHVENTHLSLRTIINSTTPHDITIGNLSPLNY
ncbi:TPA: hypothetical protein QDC03_007297 [Burkholderia cepacia]|uniref:hypothetical protein n=1 Tax=Burkholderia cepacia TaxID=292 RepID=UPI0011B1F08B|nr:hypothetical protein [Burkholderia cepacia]HDR9512051.1 hypothetical protein [Burkholderia cepacia]